MNNWKVPSYTRRDGNKACWVVEDKPRPKPICRCFAPKGEEHARLIASLPYLRAACENAIKQMQDKPVQAQGEWEQGLMCGLEDMDLTDRYAACRHGYDKALDKVQEWIIDEIEAAIEKAKP